MQKMLKKIAAVMLAATLVISLAGCNGSDENSKKKQATDAFNDTAAEFNKVATLVNENAAVIDNDMISTFQEMSSVLSEYTELLSQDTVLDDAKYDEMIEWFASVDSWTKEAEAAINDMINAANASTVEDVETTGSDENVEDGGIPAVLSNYEAYAIEDLTWSCWELNGGYADGVEMNEAAVEKVKEQLGGSFEIRFYENNVVSVYSNGNEAEGTYELLEDDYVVHMVFDNAEFYGIMTQSGDDVIYVISNVTSPDIALYLTYFEEG